MFDRSLFELPHMRMTCVALSCALVIQAALVFAQAYFLAAAIATLWATGDLGQIFTPLCIFATSFVAIQLLDFAIDTSMDRRARLCSKELRSKALGVVFSGLSMPDFDHGSASITSTLIDGIDNIETYLRVVVPKMLGLVAGVIPLLIGMFFLDWVSGIICAIMLPVIVLFMELIGESAAERAESQYGLYKRLANHFTDTLRGMPVIQAFGAQAREEEGVYATSEKFRKATMTTMQIATLSGAVLDLVSVFGVAAVALMLAFRLMDSSMPLQTALAALILAPEYFKPIRSFASNFHASLDGKSALSDVKALITSHPEPDDEISFNSWTKDTVLEMRNVSFEYDGNPVFEKVNLTFRGYEKVAVVGETGAGKSTFVDIISGFKQPCEGELYLNGRRITSLSSPSWQRNIAYLSQHPYIFSASVANNVRLFATQASEVDVRRALHIVGLDEYVDALPHGLDEMLGEGGRTLSGGQAHRIALARVILDPSRRILIVDEPTAHLDIETEMELKDRLLPLMENRLVLFATHRMHWLADMDRILAICNGAIEELDESCASRSLTDNHSLEFGGEAR